MRRDDRGDCGSARDFYSGTDSGISGNFIDWNLSYQLKIKYGREPRRADGMATLLKFKIGYGKQCVIRFAWR